MFPDEFIFPQPCKKITERKTVQDIKCSNLTDQQKINLQLSADKPKGRCISKSEIKKKLKDITPVFAAEPNEIVFKNFQLNITYEVDLNSKKSD